MDIHKQLYNIFSDLPPAKLSQEQFIALASGKSCVIKRIVSTGQTSPEDGWFDQVQNEWVVLLQGAAKISFEHDNCELTLLPGDSITIAAHQRHRVSWTDPDQVTIWLAVYFL